METRRFGRTDHLSTVAIFGGAAFWDMPQSEADEAFEKVIAARVNHIDVAPSYGKAEKLLGPWMERIHKNYFLGCKTMERTKEGAKAEMEQSLENLRVDSFDLYQFHCVDSLEELDKITSPGGAMEAMVEAKEKGLTRYIGITSHGMDAPKVLIEAIDRFDFDSVLFPVNFILFADDSYRQSAGDLISKCNDRDIGIMTIKSVSKGGWGDKQKSHTTWYQPFTEMDEIQTAVNFVLSQEVTGLCTAGDTSLLPKLIKACQEFTPMSGAEQEDLIKLAPKLAAKEPIF
ncbi:MAG: aldo/keto reductase [Anaerolineaceae bacterium]|nr:aldo/keto reductase [Anaerolineaceae bacterium]